MNKEQIVDMYTPHLICYRETEGIYNKRTGINETGVYVIILDSCHAIEIDLAKTKIEFIWNQPGELDEWLDTDIACSAGFTPISKADFLDAQSLYYTKAAVKRVNKRLERTKLIQQDSLVKQANEVLTKPRKTQV